MNQTPSTTQYKYYRKISPLTNWFITSMVVFKFYAENREALFNQYTSTCPRQQVSGVKIVNFDAHTFFGINLEILVSGYFLLGKYSCSRIDARHFVLDLRLLLLKIPLFNFEYPYCTAQRRKTRPPTLCSIIRPAGIRGDKEI